MKTVSKKLLSLLLVAILLVSALPFQAFAVEHDDSNCNMEWRQQSKGTHVQVCINTECDQYDQTIHNGVHEFVDRKCTLCSYECTAHEFENSRCKICGFECTNHVFTTSVYCDVCKYKCEHQRYKDGVIYEDSSTAEAATCQVSGRGPDKCCPDCKAFQAEGATIPVIDHIYGEDGKCTMCGVAKQGTAFFLELDANGGTVNGGVKTTVAVNKGAPISSLPTPTLEGYTFGGWYIGTDRIDFGENYSYDSDMTAKAEWTQNSYQLIVRRVLNGNNATAETIWSGPVPAGTPLLNHLNTYITSQVNSKLPVGYTWQNNYWRDYSGTQPLTGQDTCMDQAQTVFVNFVPKTYTLYFNADGGTVTPQSKQVCYDSPVGTLPTPSKSGSVFQGWKDSSGTFYDANTVYRVDGNTSLTAVWNDEALVILYIYINGDFSTCNRMVAMDQYVEGSNISRADVYAQIAKYYTPASGTLSIAGLFNEYTWASYRANTSKAGTENIQIDKSRPNKIYVMVNNANAGSTIITGNPTNPTTPAGAYWVDLGNGNGYWVYPAPSTPNSIYPTYVIIGTNPKTGDTAKIEIAAAVMVLAAAALITVMALRKKKSV